MKTVQDLRETFGNIDIYLFDQLFKGTYSNCEMVLDAGCGMGRNLMYFLKNGCQTYEIDNPVEAITQLQEIAEQFSGVVAKDNFQVSKVDRLPFEMKNLI